jgi:hypothetical protein
MLIIMDEFARGNLNHDVGIIFAPGCRLLHLILPSMMLNLRSTTLNQQWP